VTGHSPDMLPQALRHAPMVTKPYSERDLIRAVDAFRKTEA
jgi:hypothetical protein